jgi:hypothetical protein
VRHYQAPDLALAEAFGSMLGVSEGPAWDVFLLYGRGDTWDEEGPPQPDLFMHRDDESPSGRSYDAHGLADAVRARLED